MNIRYTTTTKQIYNSYLSSPYSITTPPIVLGKLNGTTNLPSLINQQWIWPNLDNSSVAEITRMHVLLLKY